MLIRVSRFLNEIRIKNAEDSFLFLNARFPESTKRSHYTLCPPDYRLIVNSKKPPIILKAIPPEMENNFSSILNGFIILNSNQKGQGHVDSSFYFCIDILFTEQSNNFENIVFFIYYFVFFKLSHLL